MNTQDQSVQIKEKYPVNLLSREWLGVDPQKVRGEGGVVIGYLYGSKNFTKMKQFAETVKLNNEQIDYWMNIAPSRQEGEEFEDYKIRMKFQRALLKYRAYIYKF